MFTDLLKEGIKHLAVGWVIWLALEEVTSLNS